MLNQIDQQFPNWVPQDFGRAQCKFAKTAAFINLLHTNKHSVLHNKTAPNCNKQMF